MQRQAPSLVRVALAALPVGALGAVLALGAVVACDRPPPPGSGALETTPPGSAQRAPEIASMPAVLSFPNGSVALTDPGACTVRLFRDGARAWEREFAGCAGFLEVAVALDSSLYARDGKSLTAIEHSGATRWTIPLKERPSFAAIATPTALADSRAALATDARTVTVYERDGTVAWNFAPPAGEILVTAPQGMKTEGLVALTTRAAYYLSASGEIRWRLAEATRGLATVETPR
jgi:outer membrane protein assembly factor BamB